MKRVLLIRHLPDAKPPNCLCHPRWDCEHSKMNPHLRDPCLYLPDVAEVDAADRGASKSWEKGTAVSLVQTAHIPFRPLATALHTSTSIKAPHGTPPDSLFWLNLLVALLPSHTDYVLCSSAWHPNGVNIFLACVKEYVTAWRS